MRYERSNKILLADGVRYEPWVPSSEDEFERVVKEHTQDIFGEQSIYLDMRQKLKSVSGIGSIPDGFVVFLGDQPQWHIAEVELSSHPLHEHIVSQVSKFISGIKNLNTQREIAKAIYDDITEDDFLKLKLEKAINSTEIYKFFADLIAEPPMLTIIIEKDTRELREAISTLAYPKEIKVVEFQTFTREGIGLPVHAHLFEPLYKHVVEPPPPLPPPSDGDTLEIAITNPSFIKFHVIYIPKDKRHFLPGYRVPFTLETDMGTIQTYVTSAPAGTQVGDQTKGVYFQTNLAGWYRQHHELKVGDRLRITVIEPMKKYRLEIVK